MSGKVLIEWRYPYCAQMTRRRYLDSNSVREMHSAISSIFFPADNEERDGPGSNSHDNDAESDDIHNENVLDRENKVNPIEVHQPNTGGHTAVGSVSLSTVPEDDFNGKHYSAPHRQEEERSFLADDRKSIRGSRKNTAMTTATATHPGNDDTSTFYNPISADISYSMRHVEESWHHLMRSDDLNKFKQIAVCNFDFLLAAVSPGSSWIPYLNVCLPTIIWPIIQLTSKG